MISLKRPEDMFLLPSPLEEWKEFPIQTDQKKPTKKPPHQQPKNPAADNSCVTFSPVTPLPPALRKASGHFPAHCAAASSAGPGHPLHGAAAGPGSAGTDPLRAGEITNK